MKYVKLGKTELTVSECGFGCIPIIRLPKEDSVKVLRHAFERGISYFDTANAYRDSEALSRADQFIPGRFLDEAEAWPSYA
jgi:aryl-alcohol dehydrogenase-like predicted oxidoreductase